MEDADYGRLRHGVAAGWLLTEATGGRAAAGKSGRRLEKRGVTADNPLPLARLEKRASLHYDKGSPSR
jgi:hypothetical protein